MSDFLRRLVDRGLRATPSRAVAESADRYTTIAPDFSSRSLIAVPERRLTVEADVEDVVVPRLRRFGSHALGAAGESLTNSPPALRGAKNGGRDSSGASSFVRRDPRPPAEPWDGRGASSTAAEGREPERPHDEARGYSAVHPVRIDGDSGVAPLETSSTPPDDARRQDRPTHQDESTAVGTDARVKPRAGNALRDTQASVPADRTQGRVALAADPIRHASLGPAPDVHHDRAPSAIAVAMPVFRAADGWPSPATQSGGPSRQRATRIDAAAEPRARVAASTNEPLRGGRHDSTPQRSVSVHIGAIEIHVAAPPPVAPASRRAPAPSRGFEEFAALRTYSAWPGR